MWRQQLSSTHIYVPVYFSDSVIRAPEHELSNLAAHIVNQEHKLSDLCTVFSPDVNLILIWPSAHDCFCFSSLHGVCVSVCVVLGVGH